jgi:uncharacterized protein
MGWTGVEKQLRFNSLNWVPNPVLGAILWSLTAESQSQLQQPFPDIVLAMGRRSLPAALWVKKQSGQKTKIIMLGRKAVAADSVDLAISCLHFRQLPRPGMFELLVPPTKVDTAALDQVRRTGPDPYATPRGKRIVVLVGGPTAQHKFNAEIAATMAAELAKAAASLGGQLTFVTSRRTPTHAVAAITANAPDSALHIWSGTQQQNPYLAYLAFADFIVVTGESESMIAEAITAGKPLTLYPLPERKLRWKQRCAESIRRRALGTSVWKTVCAKALNQGWIAPVRDLKVLHRALHQKNLAEVFDGTINMKVPSASDELTRLVEAVNRLTRK